MSCRGPWRRFPRALSGVFSSIYCWSSVQDMALTSPMSPKEENLEPQIVLRAHHCQVVCLWRGWQLVRWSPGCLALSVFCLMMHLRSLLTMNRARHVRNLPWNLTLSGIPHSMTPLTDLKVKWWSKQSPPQDRGAHAVREVKWWYKPFPLQEHGAHVLRIVSCHGEEKNGSWHLLGGHESSAAT